MGVVRLTAAGHADPVLGPAGGELPVLQWHKDTYTLPAGAVSLATSGACAAQAFRYGKNVYGLQFHIEIDSALAEVIQPQLPGVVLDQANRGAGQPRRRGGARPLSRTALTWPVVCSLTRMFSAGSATPRDSGAMRRQRERQRQQARVGIDALVWLYYDQHRDAVELGPDFLRHLSSLGVAVGLPLLDVHTTLAVSEVQINSSGGVRAADGTYHRVHTGDRWLMGHAAAQTSMLVSVDRSPCPDPTCPRWEIGGP